MQGLPSDSFDGGSDDYPDLTVVVIDSLQTRYAMDLDDWNAATLLACITEDPADWSALAAVWPRYKAGPSADFAESLPLALAEPGSAVERLRPDEPWLVLDLQQQRIFSSPPYSDVRRDGCFGLAPEEDGSSGGLESAVRISFNLPPWWEIHNDAQPQDVAQPRSSALCRPEPRREVLWGPALADALAERMLAVFQDRSWQGAGASNDDRERYPFTVAVHRDWLMTPRDDLEGRIPRESLHGGIDWLDKVIQGQQWNVAQGQSAIRLPRDLSGYAAAPMGRAEVCMYFDLCRELIEAGWQWLVAHEEEIATRGSHDAAGRLAGELEKLKHQWMQASVDGGSPPIAIINSERDRVPHVEDAGPGGHLTDCDCPVCEMMADGLFGPTFICFDGHHLELDDEFAFSLCETRSQWEMEREAFMDVPAAGAAETQADETGPASADELGPASADELGSAWQSSFVAGDLPGDPLGHLGLSFRLAEIVGELRSQAAPKAEIDRLNEAFIAYRHAVPEQRRTASDHFRDVLEQMAQQHECLLSRAADLQSKLDELLRRPGPVDADG